MSNFQALKIVDRCSETQPQVVENLNKLTLRGPPVQSLGGGGGEFLSQINYLFQLSPAAH